MTAVPGFAHTHAHADGACPLASPDNPPLPTSATLSTFRPLLVSIVLLSTHRDLRRRGFHRKQSPHASVHTPAENNVAEDNLSAWRC